jgi:hypothetical protein
MDPVSAFFFPMRPKVSIQSPAFEKCLISTHWGLTKSSFSKLLLGLILPLAAGRPGKMVYQKGIHGNKM